MKGEVEVPMESPIPVPPFGVRAKVSVVVAHLDVEPPPEPQAAPAAETVPMPSTWRHLVAPVPVFEMTRAVVEATLVTFKLVVVARLAMRSEVEERPETESAVVVELVKREFVPRMREEKKLTAEVAFRVFH